MKKRLLSLALALLLLSGASGCAPKTAEVDFFAMDTVMRITAYGPAAQAGAAAAQSELQRLESLFSRTRPESAVSQLNAAAGGAAVPIGTETVDLIVKTLPYLPYFNVGIAPVMDAWGFTGAQYRVPTQGELEALLPLTHLAELEWDETAGTMRLPLAGMKVDLGGVAKGYAADCARAVLQAQGVTSALLDLGGNITVLDAKPNGDAWRVAVRNPEQDGGSLCVLSLTHRTVSTSGGYQRYFEENGITYHHIIDPATGYPAHSGLRSTTVVSPQGTTADLLSTYCFVRGAEGALDAWREADGAFDLVLVTDDHRVLITEGLEDGLDFRGDNHGYTYEIIRR